MEEIIDVRMCQRVDTTENWAEENPVLLEGEFGIEVTGGDILFKIGDGFTPWNALPYINSGSGGSGSEGGGTITGIIMNGVLKGSSGVVDLGTVITEHQDLSGLATKQDTADELAKKQNIINDLTTIRQGAAAGATALQRVPEGYVTDSELTEQLASKVDKVPGKHLSTEDFTTALKEKLEGLGDYDSSDIEKAIDDLQSQLDTLTGGNTSKAIESFNEIVAFLEGLEDTQDLSSIIAAIEKQISDVSSAIPTEVSQLTNDAGYLTAHQDISGLATKEDMADELAKKQNIISDLTTIRQGAAAGATALQVVPDGYVTDSELTEKNFATQDDLSSGLAAKANLTIVSQSESVIASANPDTCYIITAAAAGDVRITSFAAPSKAMAQYTFMFSGANSLSLPDGVLWANGEVPEIGNTWHYELSVVGTKMTGGTIYKAVLARYKAI